MKQFMLFFCVMVMSISLVAHAASALPDAFDDKDLLWEQRIGTHQYTIPIVQDGQLFLGVNDYALQHPGVKKTGGGVLKCLDPVSGELFWEMPIPRNMAGLNKPFHFNHWKIGVCSQPAFDGDRLYIVGPRGDVLCLDRKGQADGNAGPFLSEVAYMKAQEGYVLRPVDGDIVWQFDMIKKLGVVPHDVCGSSPLVFGGFVYATTGNGHDHKHEKVANPMAPSLIVLDTRTGELVATDGGLFGERLFHGNWSSPKAARIAGRDMILFSGGDGVLYAFEPIQKKTDQVQDLKVIWQYDCNPPEYRMKDGKPCAYSRFNRRVSDGPSEIVATPVVYMDRVYVGIGQSPLHNPGQGHLCCVNGATGKSIWTRREVDRTMASVAIEDGLLYISDYSGRLFCMEADSGSILWEHELDSGVWSCSPVIVDGKVYVSTEKKVLWVLKAGREKEVIAQSRLKSLGATPAVYQNILYFPTQKNIFALKIPGSSMR